MQELTTDSIDELRAYRDALDAAGVEYDLQTTHTVEIAQNGDSAESETTSDGQELIPDLPGEGTTAREVVEAAAHHPKEWVTSDDLDGVEYGNSSPLGSVEGGWDVFEKKTIHDGSVGRPTVAYRLKEPYRRELTGQSIDVEALTEARNA